MIPIFKKNIYRSLFCYVHFPLFLITLLTACNRLPASTEAVLKTAGKNETELLKAIEHYRKMGERQKLQALYFLIENMPFHSHKQGKGTEEYNKLFNQLARTSPEKREDLNTIWDSLARDKSSNFRDLVIDQDDISTISSDFLIHHIDAAFKARDYTWSKQLSEEDFYEYILPYKLVEEKPEIWNEGIQLEYHKLQNQLDNETDPYDACLLINADLKKKFKIRSIPSYWDLNYGQLKSISSGKCAQATQFTTYVMRSMGIPVAMDFTPYWGNMNGGHEWNALIWNGKSIPFVGSESDPGKTKIDLARQRKRSKVFRHTYAIQKDGLQYLTHGIEEIPPLFKDYYMKDVTSQYVPVSDVDVVLNSPNEQFNYVFLCVFNRQEWKPIYWAKNTKGRAKFKDMGRGVAYLPVYYSGGELLPAARPFLLNQDGQVKKLDDKGAAHERIVIKKKGPQGPSVTPGNTYELFFWRQGWHLLDKKEATADSLVFANVSKNTLLWARSKDKSANERIFLYQNGKQLWW